MSRIGLVISYKGGGYCGWQRQQNGLSVQQVLEEALREQTGAETPVVGASRTDAGVHAAGQVAHFQTESGIPPEKFSYALNTKLPPDIRVMDSFAVPEDFHARFSATGKKYCYRIDHRPHASALYHDTAWHVYDPLDRKAMEKAASMLTGVHDFSSFQSSGRPVLSAVRELWTVSVSGEDPDLFVTVEGSGFLYNMVRILTGTLVDVGRGRISLDQVKRALETEDRTLAGFTAPPQGLTLMEVYYDGLEKPCGSLRKRIV